MYISIQNQERSVRILNINLVPVYNDVSKLKQQDDNITDVDSQTGLNFLDLIQEIFFVHFSAFQRGLHPSLSQFLA